jgi:glycosyltransferase involved in cell wall biosynthesis
MSATVCDVDVLVPTSDRTGALGVALSSVAAQTRPPRSVVVADQSEQPVLHDPLISALGRILSAAGTSFHVVRNLPRRGLAQQRARLLDESMSRAVLFLDDDVWLHPRGLATLAEALSELRCGFVGYAVQGLSYLDDVRVDEHAPYEEWDGPVLPERIRRADPAWARHRLHNAANLIHVANRRPAASRGWRPYKVAWIGGCVLYDRARLLDAGGFDFWPDVPPVHAGEDVVAQLRVMERHGGAGLLPSLAFHLELRTTLPEREVNCYDYILAAPEPSRA